MDSAELRAPHAGLARSLAICFAQVTYATTELATLLALTRNRVLSQRRQGATPRSKSQPACDSTCP